MATLPSIRVEASDFPAPSSIESPPWNSYDASTNRRRVPSPALQYSSDNLIRPQLEEGTSQVGDYGDTKHLENPDRFARQLSVSATADAFVEVGSRFPETPDSVGLEPWDTRSTGGESISLRSNGDSAPTLSDLIREKSRDAVSAEGRTFFPISDLEEVVTRTTARQELGNIPDLDAILDHIFLPRTVSDHKTRAFKIFVILILVGKPESIRDFIDEETYDLDLPFERPTAEKSLKGRNHYIRNTQIPGRSHSEITTFRRWAGKDLDIFVQNQHAVCVPIFDFDSQPGAPVSHYNLHGQTILPYIENEEHGLRSEGRSDVWRVKIHPAHAICPGICPNMSLAVKQLKHRVGKSLTEESQNFHKEAKNLRRFASRDHDFIIKLLCTFQWRGHYYFLFPWADGNLYDFWISHPAPLAPLKQPSTARWLSTQCLGLATALRDIHRGDSHPTLHLAPQRKNHGKHGDIKPENILYFISCGDECSVAHRACLAHLKISDLGEAEFHATTSMEVDAVLVSHTPSYSAPELRVKNVSMPNYDVFSLACVLLEFVKWYLHGFRGVDRFREKRLREQEAPVYGFNAGNLKVDGFFKHVEVLMEKSRHNGAMHKTSVNREIEQLCEDKFCSDYILDLLVFIKDRLLRLNPDNRADCDTIYKKFQELDKQCRNDEAYCVERLKQAPARSRTDRSLIVDIDIKFPQTPRIEMIRGSQSGCQIRLVNEVDISPSDPPQPIGGSMPAPSAPLSPPESPQTHPQGHLTPIEEIQVGQDLNSQQDRAVSLHNTVEAQDAADTNRQDNLPPINSSQSFKSSDGARCTDMLPIPSRVKGASSSRGSEYPGDDISGSENGGRRSERSARGLFRWAPFGKERGDRASIGVKERVLGFLRKAFCIT